MCVVKSNYTPVLGNGLNLVFKSQNKHDRVYVQKTSKYALNSFFPNPVPSFVPLPSIFP